MTNNHISLLLTCMISDCNQLKIKVLRLAAYEYHIARNSRTSYDYLSSIRIRQIEPSGP